MIVRATEGFEVNIAGIYVLAFLVSIWGKKKNYNYVFFLVLFHIWKCPVLIMTKQKLVLLFLLVHREMLNLCVYAYGGGCRCHVSGTVEAKGSTFAGQMGTDAFS